MPSIVEYNFQIVFIRSCRQLWGFKANLRHDYYRNLPDIAANIILQSWRNGTKKQYTTCLRQWEKYCEQNIDPVSATVTQGINFLGDLYEKQHLSYSALIVHSNLCAFECVECFCEL